MKILYTFWELIFGPEFRQISNLTRFLPKALLALFEVTSQEIVQMINFKEDFIYG
jgi:hypothetical protein